MAYQDINAALVSGYESVNLGLPTAYENDHFDVPDDDSPWARVAILPGPTNPATLGSGGQDRYDGVFQIDVHVPENTSTGALFGYLGQLISFFKAGSVISHNGQSVYIRKSSPTPIKKSESGASFMASVDVYWSSWVQR